MPGSGGRQLPAAGGLSRGSGPCHCEVSAAPPPTPQPHSRASEPGPSGSQYLEQGELDL